MTNESLNVQERNASVDDQMRQDLITPQSLIRRFQFNRVSSQDGPGSGVTRQSLTKFWIAETLDHGDHTAA
jgi:hypothetical protein